MKDDYVELVMVNDNVVAIYFVIIYRQEIEKSKNWSEFGQSLILVAVKYKSKLNNSIY